MSSQAQCEAIAALRALCHDTRGAITALQIQHASVILIGYDPSCVVSVTFMVPPGRFSKHGVISPLNDNGEITRPRVGIVFKQVLNGITSGHSLYRGRV